MSFHHRVTVRFFDIDRAGVVFFARFFEYCHAAFEEMLLAMFGTLEQSFTRGDWMMPVVHTEATWRAPARMGDRLDVHVRIGRLSERSVTLDYTVAQVDGPLCAELRIVHAFIDPKTGRAAPVSEAFRAGLGRLQLLPSVAQDAGATADISTQLEPAGTP